MSVYLTELHHRETHGVSVSLFWNRTANTLSVSLDDARTGEAFSVAVTSVEALEVFNHPFAYAHRVKAAMQPDYDREDRTPEH